MKKVYRILLQLSIMLFAFGVSAEPGAAGCYFDCSEGACRSTKKVYDGCKNCPPEKTKKCMKAGEKWENLKLLCADCSAANCTYDKKVYAKCKLMLNKQCFLTDLRGCLESGKARWGNSQTGSHTGG